MSTAPPYEIHRAMSTAALDFDNMDTYSMLNGDDWPNFDTASDESQRFMDFDYLHPAGQGVNRKFHLDMGLGKTYEPETPLRKIRGNSISASSGVVTPQSAGRSFSCTSLPYTPSDHLLPSPMETPLGTPLDNPMYNPFEISCDPKMAGWDFSASSTSLGPSLHSGSHVSLNSLTQGDDVPGGPLGSLPKDAGNSNGSIPISTKPASALLSRRAARSSSISSTDSRKLSIGRNSSVSSGINPFYCPPPCLRESPREEAAPQSVDPASEYTHGSETSSTGYSAPNSIQAAAAAAAAAFSTFGSASDIDSHNFTVGDDAGISPTEGNSSLYYGSLTEHDPVFRRSVPGDISPDMLDSATPHSGESLLVRSRSSSVPSPASTGNAPPHDKPFICEACNKGFRRMEHLRRHTKTHTQERPYTCTIPDCGRKFSRTDNLKAHILTHAKKTGRNTYVEGLAEMQQVKSQKKRKPKKPEANSD